MAKGTGIIGATARDRGLNEWQAFPAYLWLLSACGSIPEMAPPRVGTLGAPLAIGYSTITDVLTSNVKCIEVPVGNTSNSINNLTSQ